MIFHLLLGKYFHKEALRWVSLESKETWFTHYRWGNGLCPVAEFSDASNFQIALGSGMAFCYLLDAAILGNTVTQGTDHRRLHVQARSNLWPPNCLSIFIYLILYLIFDSGFRCPHMILCPDFCLVLKISLFFPVSSYFFHISLSSGK